MSIGLCFALFGHAVAKQWYLAEVFFGKDYFNWILSLLVISISTFFSRSYLKYSQFAFLVFLCLVVVNPTLSFYLHSFPDYTTLGKYCSLGLMSAMLMASVKEEKRNHIFAWSIEILSFVMGLLMVYLEDSRWVLTFGVGLVLFLNIWSRWFSLDSAKAYFFVGYLVVIGLLIYSTPVKIHESQRRFFDPVIFSYQSSFQQIDITHWKGEYWYYFNGVNHYSSVDPWLYYEPLVHPVMQLVAGKKKVLIVGGENGMVLKEVIKHPVDKITILPIDTSYLSLGMNDELFVQLNENVFENRPVEILAHDVFHEMAKMSEVYDVLILDLPDPLDIETNQYFTKEFYELCMAVLAEGGVLVTQSGSPYFATKAYQIIDQTMIAAGFSTAQLHNQIMTAGEWGWIIGSREERNLDSLLLNEGFEGIATHWINAEANAMMLSFGKSRLVLDQVGVNSLHHPVLLDAYREGNWQLK